MFEKYHDWTWEASNLQQSNLHSNVYRSSSGGWLLWHFHQFYNVRWFWWCTAVWGRWEQLECLIHFFTLHEQALLLCHIYHNVSYSHIPPYKGVLNAALLSLPIFLCIIKDVISWTQYTHLTMLPATRLTWALSISNGTTTIPSWFLDNCIDISW